MPAKRNTPATPPAGTPIVPPGLGSLLASLTPPFAPKTPPKPPGVPIGDRAAAVLALAYRSSRAVLLEGPTGIGKSELVRQVAENLRIEFRDLDLSLLEPPDLVGLPVLTDGRTRYAVPASLPTEGAGILLLEELNRADRTVQQPSLQLLTARKLHEYELPPGWVVFAAINPEDGEYQVTPLDPALRCRFLQLKVHADITSWRAWAARNCTSAAVRRLAAQYHDLLDTVPPRTWFYVSEVVSVMSDAEKEDNLFLSDVLSGYLPPAWVKRLSDELAKDADTTDQADADLMPMLQRYHSDRGLQQRLRNLRDAGHTDHFHQLSRRLLEIVDSAELLRLIDANAFNMDAFDALLADLPGDLRASVQKAIGDQAAVARLLPLSPAQIADPQYATSARMATVAAWANEPLQKHRVVILANAVAHWLDSLSPIDMGILKQKRAAINSLATFARQVRGTGTHGFDEVLAKHGIV